MKFKRDKSGKLEKYVRNCIKKFRPDLECIEFLCVWRDKEKFDDGQLVMAEVQKLPPKYRDSFGYDVLLCVDMNAWKDLPKDEKKKVIFHELEHVKLEYDLEKSDDKENKTAQEIFEDLLNDELPEGEPKVDKEGRTCLKIIPHNLKIARFKAELLRFGLSPDEDAIRQFLNYVYKKVGLCENLSEEENE